VVAVLLIPMVVLLVPCLLAVLERRVVADPAGARTPVALPDGATDPADVAEPAGPTAAPVAPVVPLRAGPAIDGDTIPLGRAS
jgi:hypothetical protein